MLTSDELLSSWAQLLRRLAGAEAVSLYLPATPDVPGGPWLIHDGDGPAVPELADADAAAELLRPFAAGPTAGKRRLRPLASRAPGGRLIPVPAAPRPPQPPAGFDPSGPPTNKPARRKADHSGTPELWIGLKHAGKAPGEGIREEGLWYGALVHCGTLAFHCRRVDAVLHDPVTELPGRAAFQATLRQEVAAARERERPLALVLANPDDFGQVNERFGSEAGDAVVREIAGRLKGTLRRCDRVHRYGGVVFAVVLPEASQDDAVAVANKLRAALTEGPYLDGALRLGFRLGLAVLEPADAGERPEDAAWELIRRADRGLSQAKLSASDRVVAWRPGSDDQAVARRDRLAGIFTANQAKDYRNMLLLWDTVGILNSKTDPGELTAEVVDLLATCFKPDRVGLFRWTEALKPFLVTGRGWPAGVGQADGLGGDERALVERTRAERRLVEGRVTGAGGDFETAITVPLVARGEPFGCLYLAGRRPALRLDASDRGFFEALAGQLATALDRADLAERERRLKERESRRLRAEIEALRQAAEETRLVYRSPQMEALVETVRRVASTDASVLVTGASGTGKELVSRMIHALSPRHGKPPVVVDCGAISATLIDSELFGHEKGAYTGASGRTIGRLAEAAGSTLILDEIGELPLEVQPKLLRFLQEKQIVPVGGTRPRTVDVRLVAVTNRDLETEVTAGRFRADLYYRLKVVQVRVPPLAERPDDIPLLVDHFVGKFATRYHKDVRGLDEEAAERVRSHGWPGNVRELENRILQAVILAEGDEITARDLELDADAADGSVNGAAVSDPASRRALAPAAASEEPWETLRAALRRHIETALGAGAPLPPLGRWLADDLLLTARDAADGGVREGARLLGLAKSTFARRLRQAEAEEAHRQDGWEAVRMAVADLVGAPGIPGDGLPERARSVLLEEIVALLPEDTVAGAALTGVSKATFRAWRKALAPRSGRAP